MHPRISVVTISFNQAAYLPACIESVLGQGYPNLEYILVDPGSTDGSRDIIAGYGDRVRRIFEADKGPADGLNKGFAAATGDILCYLNSDDTFEPGAFARVADLLAKDPSIDIVAGNGYVIDHGGAVLRRVYSDPFSLIFLAYDACVTVQPSTFFRRSAFSRTTGFNPANRSNWDGELLVDMVMAGARVLHVDDFLSCYRIHEQSITGSAKMMKAHETYRERMFEKILGRAPRWYDAPIAVVLRLVKHLRYPKALLERMRRGPIFGAARA